MLKSDEPWLMTQQLFLPKGRNAPQVVTPTCTVHIFPTTEGPLEQSMLTRIHSYESCPQAKHTAQPLSWAMNMLEPAALTKA